MRQCFKAVEVSFSSKCSFDTVEVPSGVGFEGGAVHTDKFSTMLQSRILGPQ